VPVKLSEEKLNGIKSRLCELPLKKQLRFVTEYGLSEYDAGVLTADRATAEYFDNAAKKAGGDVKRICSRLCIIITQIGLKIANERGCRVPELGVSSENLIELAQMVETGKVSATASVQIFEEMSQYNYNEGIKVVSATGTVSLASERMNPQKIAESHNLLQKSDAGELEVIVDKVLAENASAVGEVKAGGKKSGKARGFLLGQVMQKTKGRANPKVVSEILDKKLS
jgi:aspartyl-tRNA(Asn)/glutamyl-tRNA(Gln) amidotransferase subunit B